MYSEHPLINLGDSCSDPHIVVGQSTSILLSINVVQFFMLWSNLSQRLITLVNCDQSLSARLIKNSLVLRISFVCPKQHVELDYGTCVLDRQHIRTVPGHTMSQEFIDYHNTTIYQNTVRRGSVYSTPSLGMHTMTVLL